MTSPDIPAEGLLDLHCHILPGIDDGCVTLVESLDVVAQWHALGYRGAVCTPHVCTSWFPENCPAKIEPWTAALQRAIDAAGLRFDLWPGGEVRLAERTIEWFGECGVPTIGPGRAVLIDWWGRDWPEFCDAAIDWLADAGYQPVLAHPERMGLPEIELHAVIDALTERGVWLQGNLNSLSGGEGNVAERLSHAWLAAGRYHVLASDTHGPDSVAGRARGIERIRADYGDALVTMMLVDRPREVLRCE